MYQLAPWDELQLPWSVHFDHPMWCPCNIMGYFCTMPWASYYFPWSLLTFVRYVPWQQPKVTWSKSTQIQLVPWATHKHAWYMPAMKVTAPWNSFYLPWCVHCDHPVWPYQCPSNSMGHFCTTQWAPCYFPWSLLTLVRCVPLPLHNGPWTWKFTHDLIYM